ncbi:hypothetical protein KTO58_03070 [Chitinophaga pendula]|uniref:hypothetical protein n=1 Tax=Chitinophaga TaxID=79328 RepID=UPI000BAEFDE3|nr:MULTISPECIES: hypothetical protein [Chitinophaga]ASZ14184.1 hypothetical protein CK934_26150 [Chitinophaga sp. MD30]UCJ08180.1 hypothetical protein KTO58_03070 [Chitinophaga pendula]
MQQNNPSHKTPTPGKTTGAQKDNEVINIELPEVKDIPGQEHIKPAPMGELADITASSDDEEGKGLLDDLNSEDEDEEIENESDVTREERERLDESANTTPGDEDAIALRDAALDDTDEDGDPLNEKVGGTEWSGADLDVPGSELDDDQEDIGEEDEENNHYSQGQ